MFQSWAVRHEVSVRCGQLAKDGYLPTHTSALKVTSLRYQKSHIAEVLFAEYCAEQTFSPPSEEIYESIVVQTQHLLVQALSHFSHAQGAELAPSAKRVLSDIVQNECLHMTRILCDVFWSILVDLHSTRTLEPLKNLKPSTDPAASRKVAQSLASMMDLEEIFAAACATRSETLDHEAFSRLLTRLQLLISGNIVESLLNDMRLEGNPLSLVPPPTSVSRRQQAGPHGQSPSPPSALAHNPNGSSKDLSNGLLRNSMELSRTSSAGHSPKGGSGAASRVISPVDNFHDDAAARTPHSALSQSGRAAALRALKSEFIRWARVQKLSDVGHAKLLQSGTQYAQRASKKFRHLLSPFRFSLAVRDAVELPLVSVMSTVLVSWIRSAMILPDDGPYGTLTAGGLNAFHVHVERMTSRMLLGIAVTAPGNAHRAKDEAIGQGLRDEMSVERGTTTSAGGHQPRKPAVHLSLNSTARCARTAPEGGADNQPFAVSSEGAPSSPMDAAMLPFTKLVRLGLRQVPPAPPSTEKPTTSSLSRDIVGKHRGLTTKSSQHFYTTNPSTVYRSFQTMLSVMDEEVVHERKPGNEANIHRASKYIVAQQKLANIMPSQRLPDEMEDTPSPIASDAGGASPKRKAPLPYGAVSLEDMLRDELRPECVRQALENGASSAIASAQSIFQKHDVHPLSTKERLSVILDQGEAKAAAMVRPFSARRRTAPVADITSATSQRTIVKHARRLQQEQESARSTAERSLEKQSFHLMREYHHNIAPRVPTIAGQSPEDAAILRLQLMRSNEQFLRVLRHTGFLFLKNDLRLSLVQCSTAVGKDLKTLQRMHQRFRRAGLLVSDDDDDDDDAGEDEHDEDDSLDASIEASIRV